MSELPASSRSFFSEGRRITLYVPVDLLPGSMGNDGDGRSQPAELLGQDSRYRLDPTDAGREDIGTEKNFHRIIRRNFRVPAKLGRLRTENESD